MSLPRLEDTLRRYERCNRTFKYPQVSAEWGEEMIERPGDNRIYTFTENSRLETPPFFVKGCFEFILDVLSGRKNFTVLVDHPGGARRSSAIAATRLIVGHFEGPYTIVDFAISAKLLREKVQQRLEGQVVLFVPELASLMLMAGMSETLEELVGAYSLQILTASTPAYIRENPLPDYWRILTLDEVEL